MGMFGEENAPAALGAVYGNSQTEENQRRQIRANEQTQARDHEFQKMMRNTMYQDMTKDLRKAGLNPILAYNKQGVGGAPSGQSASGASGTAPSTPSINPQEIFSAKLMYEQAKTEEARQDNIKADTQLKGQKTTRGEPWDRFLKSFQAGEKGGEYGKFVDKLIDEGQSLFDSMFRYFEDDDPSSMPNTAKPKKKPRRRNPSVSAPREIYKNDARRRRRK